MISGNIRNEYHPFAMKEEQQVRAGNGAPWPG
jgi:hypothetical protein